MSVFDVSLAALDGSRLEAAMFRDRVVLVVNVASRCGLTPQYETLEALQRRYEPQGFTVLGASCNQFAEQELDDPEAIATFCSTTYGVTFPIAATLDVNGRHRHPLYDPLTAFPDADGFAGDVAWNFEKMLVSRVGEVVARFRPQVAPDDERVVAAIEAALAAPTPGAAAWRTVAAADVRPGERVRPRAGFELTATRVETAFLGFDGMLAFVEDSAERWLKLPAQCDADVEVLRRPL